MSKQSIAATLFRMKKEGQEVTSIEGRLLSIDELLSAFLGRFVSEEEGHEFAISK